MTTQQCDATELISESFQKLHWVFIDHQRRLERFSGTTDSKAGLASMSINETRLASTTLLMIMVQSHDKNMLEELSKTCGRRSNKFTIRAQPIVGQALAL